MELTPIRRRFILVAFATILLICDIAAFGQRFSAGLIGGAGLTSDFQNSAALGLTSAPYRYIVGAEADARLPMDFVLELDAIYRPLGFLDTFTEEVAHNSVITWEFPLLVKHRIPFPVATPALTPFVELGPSFRWAGNLNGFKPSHAGVTAGLGLEMHLRDWTVTPAVRYTRWAPDGILYRHLLQDQAELVVGFSNSSPRTRRWARHFSIGLDLGATLTKDYSPFSGGATNSQQVNGTYLTLPGPRGLIVGPTLGCEFYKGLSIEAALLFRSWRQSTQFSYADGTSLSTSARTGTMEFPVLARYKLSRTIVTRSVKPFLEAGPSFRARGDLAGAARYGISAGVGIATHLRGLTMAPLVRYTHWAAEYPAEVAGPHTSEVIVLAGFSF